MLGMRISPSESIYKQLTIPESIHSEDYLFCLMAKYNLHIVALPYHDLKGCLDEFYAEVMGQSVTMMQDNGENCICPTF